MRALLLAQTCVLVVGCAEPSRVTVRRDLYLMGTTVSLETTALHRDEGLRRLEEFVRILEATEEELSTWRQTSTISRLNQTPAGRPLQLEEPLCFLLLELQAWSVETNGAFDPSLGNLIDVWGLRDEPRIPSHEELQAARLQSGYWQLVVDRESCDAVRLNDIRLDAGGFGKGEALDRVADTQLANDSDWLINMGGQVLAHGTRDTGDSWSVGLAHPNERNRVLLTIELRSGSLATTGGSERDVWSEDGQRIGHIIDPRTGLAVSRPESVVVWHPRALIADVLSTALYVMGWEDGIRWAEARGVSAAFLVPSANTVEVRATSSFRKHFPEVLYD